MVRMQTIWTDFDLDPEVKIYTDLDQDDKNYTNPDPEDYTDPALPLAVASGSGLFILHPNTFY